MNTVSTRELYNGIAKGYDWLYNKAINTGHWGDIRSTALASLALELREPVNSKWLQSSKSWLLGKQLTINESYYHWNEEIWDTAMAIHSLSHLHLNQKDPRFQKCIDWIVNLYNKTNRNNWHDEPWETCWALIAILEINSRKEYISIVTDSLDWLLSFKSADGMIIAPHYTAYYLIIFEKLSRIAQNFNIKLDKKYSLAADEASYYLINAVKPDILWNGEAWANGQILWAICYSGRFPISNSKLIELIVNWFSLNQEDDAGNWEDEEDTASALIGLSYLLMAIEEVKTNDDLRRILRDKYESPQLKIKPKLIEHHSNGYYSINLSPFFLKLLGTVFLTISIVGLVLGLWNDIIGLFK